MSRFSYRVEIAYRGSAFWGFARQPAQITVESRLREAIGSLLGTPPSIAVGGRTDRGVHALGQVISFRTRRSLPLQGISEAIDAVAPSALWALDTREVPRRFHARFSAQARRYMYLYEPRPDERVDVPLLDRLLRGLIGRRCFSAFARDTQAGKSTSRRMISATARPVLDDGHPKIRMDFAADGFLRKQIRVTVATALREMREGAPDDRLAELAATQDRRATAPPADPDGLYLARIIY